MYFIFSYLFDLSLEKNDLKEVAKDQAVRKKARQEVRAKLEDRYKTGKNKWFFTKLRF